MKRFYADWYRPDLMAVIAVGDFDKASVEALIKQHFGSIPAAKNPKPRPTYDVPASPGTRFTIATDKEATSTDVSVYALMKARSQTTVGDYRRQIVEGLYGSLLSNRLAELSRAPDAPFLAASVGVGPLVRTEEASILNAAAKENQVETALDALFTQTARVARFGFTATELDRAKQNLMRSYDEAVTEKDNEPSQSLAAEFGRNFTTGEPMPGNHGVATVEWRQGRAEADRQQRGSDPHAGHESRRHVARHVGQLHSGCDGRRGRCGRRISGSLNVTDLVQKVMTGKLAAVRPFFGETESGVAGGADTKDLETMFQPAPLRRSPTARDATAFAVELSQAKALLANQAADPQSTRSARRS